MHFEPWLRDRDGGRLTLKLTFFGSICNSRKLTKKYIVHFFNKIDLFKDKLLWSPMEFYFPDFEGGSDYEAACNYILNRFVSLNMSETKQIHTYFTCALDTAQAQDVMAAVHDTFMESWRNRGFM